jgi:hypothetical protein
MMNKRDDWGFVELGKVEIKEIKKEVDLYFLEWLKDISRQSSFETHQHTFFIPIRQLEYGHELGKFGVCKRMGFMKSDSSNTELDNIILFLEKAALGRAVRVEFVNMKPNSRIRTHKDRSDLLYVCRRFHIPIKTNDLVTFTSGKYTKHLEEAKAYELNNINYHSVKNESQEHRVHLIVDVLPNHYLENIEYED